MFTNTTADQLLLIVVMLISRVHGDESDLGTAMTLQGSSGFYVAHV
jgi:hypothetical protein